MKETLYYHQPMGKEFLTVVTRKGQITIPAEVRRTLGIKQGDRVAIRMEDEQICLMRSESVVARTAGMLKSDEAALSAEELRAAAEQAVAEAAAERSGA